jgi:hypothetical protein
VATIPFDAPHVLGFHVPEHIVITIGHDYPKIGFSRRIPAVFHFGDFQDFLVQPKSQGPFLRPVARVTLHLYSFHGASPIA